MSKGKLLRFWGIALVVATAFAFAASTRLISQDDEKTCPITFRLYPGTLLERNYVAKIEKDNANLTVFLGDFGKAARAAIEAKMPLDSPKWYLNYLKTDGHVNPFEKTYLVNPKLTTEKGLTVEGVPNVLAELSRIISKSTHIAAQSVDVYLEYLPYLSDAYKAKNPPGTPEDKIIDIIAHIKTVLALAPDDDPVTIEGTLPHRRVCDPIY